MPTTCQRKHASISTLSSKLQGRDLTKLSIGKQQAMPWVRTHDVRPSKSTIRAASAACQYATHRDCAQKLSATGTTRWTSAMSAAHSKDSASRRHCMRPAFSRVTNQTCVHNHLRPFSLSHSNYIQMNITIKPDAHISKDPEAHCPNPRRHRPFEIPCIQKLEITYIRVGPSKH